MRTLRVELAERGYPIHVGDGVLDRPECYEEAIRGRRVVVVTNQPVAALFLARLEQALRVYDVTVVRLPDGEAHKTLATVEGIWDAMLAVPCDRRTTVIALGGGVIGDIAGFAAACYQRGVDLVQVPTTLLAQVDSSVGGKTGVNHPLGKNMIGAFHQPRCVVADTGVLATLPPRELSAGLAEVIKYGLIGDLGFLEWLEESVDVLGRADPGALAEAVERSCLAKAAVVAQDEHEQGVRATLNLGHTFGHAIEAELGYGEWLHGEAVAAGMVLASQMSARLGWLGPADVDRVRRLLVRAGLPVVPPQAMSRERFLTHMARDKKALDARIRLVLLRRLGRADVVSDYPDEVLHEVLDAACP